VHTTGERFENVVVGADFVSGSPILEPYAITVSDSTINWTRSEYGNHQVQDATTLETVCDGGSSCTVPAGNYLVVNGNSGVTTSIRVSNNGEGGMKLNQPSISSYDGSDFTEFNFATWRIDDGLTTTNGLPNGGSTNTSLFAGTGAGIHGSQWYGADLESGSFGPRVNNLADNASMLMWINDEQVGGYLRSVFPADLPHTTDFSTESMSGLQVTLQYHAVRGSSIMRHYTTMRNDTDADIVAVVDFASNPYELTDFAPSRSVVHATSSDDATLGTNDRLGCFGHG